jgi:uncharacterized protein (TIRG00374 family)
VRKHIFNTAKKILPFIGLILLLIYIFFYLELDNPEKLTEAQKHIITILTSIYLPIAVILTIPRIMIRNYAWQIVLKEQDIRVGYWQSLKIFLIGYFYGSFTPGYYGQLMRIPYLKEKTEQPYGKLFINTLIEIILRSVTIYIIILIGAIIFLSNQPEYLYIILIWTAIFLSIILYFIKKERGEKIFFGLVKYLIPKKLKPHLNSFVATFYEDFPRLKVLINPMLLSTITWFIIFTQEYIIVIALGLDIPYFAFLFIFPIANVAGFIPITFAGIGIRELTAIAIFTVLYPSVTEIEIFVIAIIGFIVTDVITGFAGFLLSLTETVDKKNFIKNLS